MTKRSSWKSDPIKVMVGMTVAGGLVESRLNEYWTSCLIGGVLSSVFVKVLKRAIGAKRPGGGENKDHGFPSSHTHQVAFFATYAIWRAFATKTNWWAFVLAGITAMIVTAMDRLRRKEHSTGQVVGGIVTGCSFALVFCVGWLDFYGGQEITSRFCQDSHLWQRLVVITGVSVLGILMVSDLGRKIAGGHDHGR